MSPAQIFDGMGIDTFANAETEEDNYSGGYAVNGTGIKLIVMDNSLTIIIRMNMPSRSAKTFGAMYSQQHSVETRVPNSFHL